MSKTYEAEVVVRQVWRLRFDAESEGEAWRRLMDAEHPARGMFVIGCQIERREIRRVEEVAG